MRQPSLLLRRLTVERTRVPGIVEVKDMATPDTPKTSEATPDHADIGKRVRYLRLLKRMRLRDLADAVGCSESLVSKIERNKSTPSLHMLHRIMAALDSNIASLFDAPGQHEVTVFWPDERPVVPVYQNASGPGIRLERLAPTHNPRILDGNIHNVDPGADNGGEIKHEGEEIGYVLSGELELTVAGQTFHLIEGSSFHFRSNLPHSYRNRGRYVARIIWINSPPTF